MVSLLFGEPVPLTVSEPLAVQYLMRMCSFMPVEPDGAVMPVMVADTAVGASSCCSPEVDSTTTSTTPFAAVGVKAEDIALSSYGIRSRCGRSLLLDDGFLWRHFLNLHRYRNFTAIGDISRCKRRN